MYNLIVIIIVALVAFFVGRYVGCKSSRETIKDLNDKLSSVISKSADKLTTAYEKIEKLQNDNAELLSKIKVLAHRVNEYRTQEESVRNALIKAFLGVMDITACIIIHICKSAVVLCQAIF